MLCPSVVVPVSVVRGWCPALYVSSSVIVCHHNLLLISSWLIFLVFVLRLFITIRSSFLHHSSVTSSSLFIQTQSVVCVTTRYSCSHPCHVSSPMSRVPTHVTCPYSAGGTRSSTACAPCRVEAVSASGQSSVSRASWAVTSSPSCLTPSVRRLRRPTGSPVGWSTAHQSGTRTSGQRYVTRG